MAKIILGSASAARKNILKQMGLEFETHAPNIDEKSIRVGNLRDLPEILARAKNQALHDLYPDAVLITADSIILHGGELREKPLDEREHRHFLKTSWEKPVEVLTALAVRLPNSSKIVSGIDSAKVYFHKFPDSVLEELVRHGVGLEAAGGFVAEHPLVHRYISYVEGEMDTVMGLSRKLLKKLLEG